MTTSTPAMIGEFDPVGRWVVDAVAAARLPEGAVIVPVALAGRAITRPTGTRLHTEDGWVGVAGTAGPLHPAVTYRVLWPTGPGVPTSLASVSGSAAPAIREAVGRASCSHTAEQRARLAFGAQGGAPDAQLALELDLPPAG